MNIFDVLERLGTLKSRNYSRARLKANFTQYPDIWKAHYRGDVAGINQDTAWNGEDFYPVIRRSMRLAKLIAQRWVTLLFTEAFTVTLKDDTETEKFRQLEKQIDFRSKINQAALWGYSEGTSALLASADIEIVEGAATQVVGGKVKLDCVKYENLYPLAFDKDDIQSIAFVKQEQEKDKTIYTISIHTSAGAGQVEIENIIATVKGEQVDFTAAETVTQSQTFNNQMYAWIKPNIVNDFSDILPFGQSIFADALAPIVDVDLAADGLRRDLEESPQLTFVGRDMFLAQMEGEKRKKVLDNSRGKFFIIPQKLGEQGSDIKQLFERVTPEIRTEAFWQVVKDSLDWATMTSGLGHGSLDVSPRQTATQTVYLEAEKMQNKSLHEQYLEGQIIKIVKALCELSTLTGNLIDASEVNIVWSDSVIVDTNTEKKVSLQEIDARVLSKSEYRERYMGESPEEAAAKIAAMVKEDDLFNFQRLTDDI